MKMNRNLKNIGLAVLLIALSTPALAADLSTNLGFSSEYIYRGIPQAKASVSGGLDLEAGGFYLGTWGADVGDGAEIDFYGGYGFNIDDFSFGIGATIYTYTGDFDDTYEEVNLSAGWKFVTLDVAIGSYDNFDGPTENYQFYSFTAEYKGFYGKVGMFEDDFDGTYFEAGYGGTLSLQDSALMDYTFSVVQSDSTLLNGKSDTNVLLSLSRAFDL
jgi:uncharacterized protein (TIGR02001 family)